MTELEWQNSREPESMLHHLAERPTPRKWRLLACACCRRVWHMLHDRRSRRAVEAAEQFADGIISTQILEQAQRGAWTTWEDWPRMDVRTFKAVGAAAWVAKPSMGLAEALVVLQGSLAAECRMEPADATVDRCNLIRDLFGALFCTPAADPAWLAHGNGAVLAMSRTIYEERRFEDMPILADALEDAGCTDAEILNHCRATAEHGRGCWVLDLLLDKERPSE